MILKSSHKRPRQREHLLTLPAPPLDTRMAAYHRIEPTKRQTCDLIMQFAIVRGAYGFIPDELADLWQCTHNHVAPRITELKAACLLVKTASCRLTRAGSPARVLVARQFNKPCAPIAPSQFLSTDCKSAVKSLFGDLSPEGSYPD